jgi:hypothetical protein
MPSFDEELQAALAGDGGKGGSSFDDELKGALTDPSQGGRVPPEQQQPSDPSPRVVDNPQASVRAGIPEQGPPPAQNQQIEPQSKDWLTGAITALANGYRAIGGTFADDGVNPSQPAIDAAPAYNARMQDVADHPWKTAARVVSSLAAPVVSGMGGAIPQAASAALETYGDTGDAQKAGMSGLAGGVVAKGAELGGRAVSALAREFQESGLKNRLSAAGLDFDKLAAEKGPQAALQVARDIEEQGLHKGKGVMGWAPQPAQTYADNAAAANAEGLAGMKSAEEGLAALPNPPRVNLDPIQQKLRASAGQNARMIDPAGAQDASFRADMADRMQQYGGNDWQNALDNRRYLDSNINWGSRGGYEGAGMQEQARRDVANPLREEISSALDRGMANNVDSNATQFAPSVPRELGQGWQNARDQFALGAQVEPAARQLATQQQGAGFLSPAGLAGGAAALGGMYTGHPVAGLAAGLGTQLARNRGSSAMAGSLEGASSALGTMGEGASWLSNNAGIPAAAAGGGDIAQSLLNRGQRQAPMQTSGGSQGMENSRGDITSQQVESILHDENRAKALQPWATELAANNAAKDDSAFAANIEKLQRKDQKFRERVKMLLGQNVGGQ